MPLRRDKRFQRNAVGDFESRAALKDQTLLLEAREKSADGFSRSSDHLPDLLVSQSQLHLGGVSGFSVLVEPTHQESSKLFAGRVRKYQVAHFAARGGVTPPDVLGHPQGKLAVKAHEAQQIALSQE